MEYYEPNSQTGGVIMSGLDFLIPAYIIAFLAVFALSFLYLVKKPNAPVLLVIMLFMIEEAIIIAVFFKLAYPIEYGMVVLASTYIGVVATVVGVIIMLSTLLVKKRTPDSSQKSKLQGKLQHQ
jgi:hypothetical protein